MISIGIYHMIHPCCCFCRCLLCPISSTIAIRGTRMWARARRLVSSSSCARLAMNTGCLFLSAPTRLGRCSLTAYHLLCYLFCWTNSQMTPVRTASTKARSMWSSLSAGSCCLSSRSASTGNCHNPPISIYSYLKHSRRTTDSLAAKTVWFRKQKKILIKIVELS